MIVKGHLVEKFLNDERFPLRINASFVASFGAEFGSSIICIEESLISSQARIESKRELAHLLMLDNGE